MISYTKLTATQILEKPLRVRDVARGLNRLEVENIITQNTVNACMNLIYSDFQTEGVALIEEMKAVQTSLTDYAGYLYRTTDELTQAIAADASNTALINDVRTELNTVFDKMTEGYTDSAGLTIHTVDLETNFWSNTAMYRVDPTLYEVASGWPYYDGPIPSGLSYPATPPYSYDASINTIIDEFFDANTQYLDYANHLAGLMSKYPWMTIESGETVGGRSETTISRRLPKEFWFVLRDAAPAVHPELFVYGHDPLATPATYREMERYPVIHHSLIADNNESYTAHFINEATGAASTYEVSWIDSSITPGNAGWGAAVSAATSITSGSSAVIPGRDLCHLIVKTATGQKDLYNRWWTGPPPADNPGDHAVM